MPCASFRSPGPRLETGTAKVGGADGVLGLLNAVEERQGPAANRRFAGDAAIARQRDHPTPTHFAMADRPIRRRFGGPPDAIISR